MATVLTDKLIADFDQFKWFKRLDDGLVLNSGDRSPDLLKIPEKDSQRVLAQVVRLVLDPHRWSSGPMATANCWFIVTKPELPAQVAWSLFRLRWRVTSMSR